MAYHGHPSTGTEASLEKTRVLSTPSASGASEVVSRTTPTRAGTRKGVWLIILAAVVVGGVLLVAYLFL